MRRVFVGFLCFGLAAAGADAAIFIVTSNGDAGANTLRDAITQANGMMGPDTINFAIGMAGSQQTITLMTALPNITEAVTIDGWTQGGAMYMGPPLIEIVGVHNMMSGSPVLYLGADGCTVRGLALVHAAGVTLGGDGIVLASMNNWVCGCYVGLGLDGSTAKPNYFGVFTNFNGNLIGTNGDGTQDAAEANVISGNLTIGVDVTTSMNNTITGNLIGTDKTGTLDRGNGSQGVEIDVSASANTVGGTIPARRNIISGNGGSGVRILRSSNANSILGNYIGTNLAGTGALGNTNTGITCGFGASGNMIGGTAMGAGNLIAHNGNDGVLIEGDTTIKNSILRNSIHSNGELGIDLAPDGVTPNDADADNDADTGPNNLQNFPIICANADFEEEDLSVGGYLQSEPNKVYRIEFFASAAADASGYGEGQEFFRAVNVMTNATGFALISFSDNPVPGKPFITAIATDPDGNTSEFSEAKDAEDGSDAPTIMCEVMTPPLNDNCQATIVFSATITEDDCFIPSAQNPGLEIMGTPGLQVGAPVVSISVVNATTIHLIASVLVTASDTCGDDKLRGFGNSVEFEIKARDCCGNERRCSKTAFLYDLTKPTVSCRVTNPVVPVPVNDQCEALVMFSAIVKDNCCLETSGSVLPTFSVLTSNATLSDFMITPTSPSQKELRISGKFKVKNLTSCPAIVQLRFVEQDCCDNSITMTCTVAVTDATPPMLVCPPPVRIESCVPAIPENTGFPMVTLDNCASQVVMTSYVDMVTPGPSAQGSLITRTWTAMDGCGNVAMCTQDITIVVVPAQTGLKADLFVWPHVRIKWDDNSTPSDPSDDTVLSDTFISVTNDDTAAHPMKFYFVDGKTWANANRTLNLTGNQSKYFSCFSGMGGSTSGMAFRSLNPVGLPDGPNGNIRKLEGFIIGFTIDSNGKPFGSNQIAASATIVDREKEAAWEYKPWGFRSCFVGVNPVMDKLCLNGLDGNYQMCPSHLLVDFWSAGTGVFGPTANAPVLPSVQDFEVTILNMTIDLRAVPDHDLDGTPGELPTPGGSAQDSTPPTTAVEVLAWNEGETQVSNTVRCVTCWDTKLASAYGIGGAASPFARSTLQTDKGKARLRGKRDARCDQSASSPNAQVLIYEKLSKSLPILGVVHKIITWGPDRVAKANSALTGMGGRAEGFIRFDTTNQGPPPTLTNPAGTMGDTDGIQSSRNRR